MFRIIRPRSRKVISVKVDYTIYIHDIKHWPPSQSLKSVESLVLQWSNGVCSGSIQSTASSDKDGKIEFKESFKLHVTLSKDAPVKGHTAEVFHKNLMELNIYGLTNKASKGPLIGSAQVDLAEHGVIKDTELDISVPVNCRKIYKCTSQPVLFISIQSFDKEGSVSSPKAESVSDLMNERKLEEAEITSFTDDNLSHSSFDISGPPSEENLSSPQRILNEQLHRKSDFEGSNKISEVTNTKADLHTECVSANKKVDPAVETYIPDVIASFQSGSSSLASSVDFCDRRSYEEGEYSPSDSVGNIHSIRSSFSSMPSRNSEENFGPKTNPYHNRNPIQINDKSADQKIGIQGDFNHPAELEDAQTDILLRKSSSERRNGREEMETSIKKSSTTLLNSNPVQHQEKSADHEMGMHDDFNHLAEMVDTQSDILPIKPSFENISEHGENQELGSSNDLLDMKHKESQPKEDEDNTREAQNHLVDVKQMNTSTHDDASSLTTNPPLNHPPNFLQRSLSKPTVSNVFAQRLLDRTTFTNAVGKKRKNMRSMRLVPNIMTNITPITKIEDLKENDGSVASDGDDINHFAKDSQMYEKKHSFSERIKCTPSNKIRDLELTVQMLKEELIETASVELGLHSIVAEHGSSVYKVHTPARRLSRMYIQASKKWSSERKANAARSAVSGLILAAKACGNDISRLTFWLSNTVTLRAIITLTNRDPDLPTSSVPDEIASDSGIGWNENSPRLKWKSGSREKINFPTEEDFDDWEDPNTVTNALEKIEAWMFSRITESVWWQILTPHMQSTYGSEQLNMDWQKPNKFFGRNIDTNQQQADNSIKIWEKAFKDVQARLCPVRADGHECGCLPMLAGLAMEQCITKLDVAMFNAILRESDDDIPTDPISDPISDPKVLPIPVGKTSFNSGALLKNAVGNWSRELCDLFGIDESPVDKKDDNADADDDERQSFSIFLKPFILLNALSNLLMIPKHMLLQNTVRKRLCPVFSGPMIRHILNNFVPDEFCPDSISDDMLQALGSLEPEVATDVLFVKDIPCKSTPIVYSPPSIASITSFVGDAEQQTLRRRSGSSVIHKYHGSDDELDEVESLFDKVVLDRSSEKSKEKGHHVIRYELLREVWSNDYMLRI